jgi:hypothetical protein
MNSGKLIPDSSNYSNECCLIQLEFKEDHIFPRCPRCGRQCSWQATKESRLELEAA